MSDEQKDPKVVLISASASVKELPKVVEEVLDKVAQKQELIVIGNRQEGAQDKALEHLWDKGKQTYTVEPSHKPDAAIVIWNGDKKDKAISDAMNTLKNDGGKVFLYNETTGKSQTITHDQYFKAQAKQIVKEDQKRQLDHSEGMSI